MKEQDMKKLEERLNKHIDLLVSRYPSLAVIKDDIVAAYLMMEECYTNGGKLLIAGNGGSAADAKAKGMKIVELTGANDSRLAKIADVCVQAPQTETYMIQELHLPIYHCWCLMLEEKFREKLKLEGNWRGISMHVLYFVQYFPPEKTSGSYLVTDLVKGMMDKGWSVDIYTPTPTRNVEPDKISYYKKHRIERWNEKCTVTIHRIPLYQEKASTWQRFIRYFLFTLECLWIGLITPADAVFCGSGPPTQGLMLGLLHKLTKKRIVYNLQDAFPDSLVTTGITTEGSAIWKVGSWLERFTYNNVDAIITISNSMKEKMIEKVKKPEIVSMVYNWTDDSVYHVERAENDLFDRYGINRTHFIVTYAGNVGKAQGIITLLKTAECLQQKKNIEFVIFGAGSELEECKEFADEHDLKNVRFLPLLGKDEISKVYSLGDASVVMCKKGVGASGMPSKVWSIVSAETLLIVSFDRDSELYELVKKNDCGLTTEAEQYDVLAQEIIKASKNKEQRDLMISNALRLQCNIVSKQASIRKYLSCIAED